MSLPGGVEPSPPSKRSPLSILGLVLCTFCITVAGSLIQATKSSDGGYAYSYYSLTTMVETVKLCIAVVGLRSQATSWKGAIQTLRDVPARVVPRYAIPAALYTFNNNVYYVILTFLDPATFQVVSSFKIVSTAVLMYTLLGKRLSAPRWLSVLVLTFATAAVQYDKNGSGGDATNGAEGEAHNGETLVGFSLALVYCFLSGFAGVVTESLLKGAHTASFHASNFYLYMFGVLFNLGAYVVSGHAMGDFFNGFTPLVVCVVLNSSLLGTLVSAVMKFFDNIVKVYLNSVAIVLSVVSSAYMSGSWPSPLFSFAVICVTTSAVAYHAESWGPLQALSELLVAPAPGATARKEHP